SNKGVEVRYFSVISSQAKLVPMDTEDRGVGEGSFGLMDHFYYQKSDQNRFQIYSTFLWNGTYDEQDDSHRGTLRTCRGPMVTTSEEVIDFKGAPQLFAYRYSSSPGVSDPQSLVVYS